ncbi:UDP-N-acetylglucosamine transferase subunit ALG14 [Pseudomonas stutzeri]|nr:UDP-N-acetylglucosamine transferase subunit ALG14 [Stutzerimonas stutzeri]
MSRSKKVLAVASAGGHWTQLMRLSPAYEHHDVTYISTDIKLSTQVEGNNFIVVRDANMRDKASLLLMAFQVALATLKVRPDIIITTGAAPGFFAIVIGKLMRKKTIWVDSIANSEELSLAGKKARKWADHWLTQWPHLDTPEGPKYMGSVL